MAYNGQNYLFFSYINYLEFSFIEIDLVLKDWSKFNFLFYIQIFPEIHIMLMNIVDKNKTERILTYISYNYGINFEPINIENLSFKNKTSKFVI